MVSERPLIFLDFGIPGILFDRRQGWFTWQYVPQKESFFQKVPGLTDSTFIDLVHVIDYGKSKV